MSFISALFSSLKSWIWNDSSPIAEIPKQTMLAGLPSELLLLVAEFLFWEDVACMSLCNRRLYATFCLWINSMPRSRNGKLYLLTRLERDLPCYFTCYVCHILHKFDASQKHWAGTLTVTDHQRANKRINDLSRWFDEVFRLSPIVRYKSYCRHVELIRTSMNYGRLFGFSIDSVTHTGVNLHNMNMKSTGPHITSLYSTDAQICSSSEPSCLRVIVRVQQIMFVQHHQRYLMYCDPNGRDIKSPPLSMSTICEHLSMDEFADIVNSTLRAYHNGEKSPSSSHTCASNECDTNYRIEICECETDPALVITTWFQLGPDLSPNDSQCNSHSMDYTQTSAGTGKVNLERCDTKVGVRVCFENFNTLQSRNLSYLKNQRYKEVMHEDPLLRNRWCLPK